MNNIKSINYKCELLKIPVKQNEKDRDVEYLLDKINEILLEIESKRNLIFNPLKYGDNAKLIRTLIKRAYRIVNK